MRMDTRDMMCPGEIKNGGVERREGNEFEENTGESSIIYAIILMNF